MSQDIEATLSVAIRHYAGAEIADPAHVLNWVVADGNLLDGEYNGFQFQVCPAHADPEECDCFEGYSTYRANVFAAGLDAS